MTCADWIKDGSARRTGALEAVAGILSELPMSGNNRHLQTAMRASRLSAVKTLVQFDAAIQPGIEREQIESLHDPGFLGHPERGRLNWRSAWRWRARPNPRSEQVSIGTSRVPDRKPLPWGNKGTDVDRGAAADRCPARLGTSPFQATFGLIGSGGFISIGACGASSRGFVQPPGCLALRYRERRWCAIHGP